MSEIGLDTSHPKANGPPQGALCGMEYLVVAVFGYFAFGSNTTADILTPLGRECCKANAETRGNFVPGICKKRASGLLHLCGCQAKLLV